LIEANLNLRRTDFDLDVALQLPAQGISVLFGPSGCGKTTLLRALAGLDRARGRFALETEVWQDDSTGHWLPTHQRALGYVTQEAALFPHLDVRANLEYGRRRSGPAAKRFALDAVVDLLGIDALMQRRPSTLSGGERQRVAIARALATAPRLLLMDEPLAALDAQRKAEILPYLERLHRELALPIVYVTHAMDEVARLADHLVLLQAGRVLAAGPLSALLSRTDLPLARQDDAGVVIEADVTEHDPHYGLSRIGFAGGSLWVGETQEAIGKPVRARVLARDVSITKSRPTETSVINVLPVVLEAVEADHSTVLLKLRVSDTAPAQCAVRLLARITKRSCESLSLQPGDALFAQIKGVALMEAHR
jgi:molybdate transport system ATP-binding protein